MNSDPEYNSKGIDQVILKYSIKIKMLQRCLNGINNMAKDHTISYQRKRLKGPLQKKKKKRLPSAGVNIYICFICHDFQQ